MGRIIKVILGVVLVLTVFLVGMLIGRRTSGQSIKREAIATIGDHPIYRGQLNLKLQLFERRALELLCYEYLIESEAQKRNLKTQSQVDDPTLSGVEAKLQDLLLQLAVQGISEDYFRRIYDAFPDELATYDLQPAFFISESALTAFQHDLPGDFTALSGKHGTKVPGEYQWKGLTLRNLAERLGPDARNKVHRLKDGEVSKAIPYQGGFLVLKVIRIGDSYEELRPEIVKMVGQSREFLVLDSLLSRNPIVTNMPIGRLHRLPEPMEKVDASAAALPAPSSTPGNGVATPAKFDPNAPTVGPGIPKPTATGAAPGSLPELSATPAVPGSGGKEVTP